MRKWWKEHASEWPQLAKAARDLLPYAALEVDVKRLFSGYRDKYRIRRHLLKADTVRVMTLLRSAYTTEDTEHKDRIEMAMKLELKSLRFSILWRPDEIHGHLADGKLFTLDLRMYTDYFLL